MYSISRLIHNKYDAVIQIEYDLNGSLKTPFQAINAAFKEQRIWQEAGQPNVRLFIDGQIMSVLHSEHWAFEEYKILPKCFGCAKILNDDVKTYMHHLFCSDLCIDKYCSAQLEKMKDQEEVEFA